VPNAFAAKHFQVGQAEALGTRLKDTLAGRICAFDPWPLTQCWAWPLLKPDTLPSDANPPHDRYAHPHDAAISNVVLLQRYEWLKMAALAHPEVDVFAWVEYTIFKQRGVKLRDQAMHQFEAEGPHVLPQCL
jgi:hypothetical protein